MRKSLVYSLIGLAMIGCLAGCGKKKPAAGTETKTQAAETAAPETTEAAPEGYPYVPADEAWDYTGYYVADLGEGAYDEVIMSLYEDNSYDVYIGLSNLCQIDGVGNWMDGAVELALTDPDGDPLYAIFFPEEDGTFTLRVTQSSWDQLHEMEDFTGFILSEEMPDGLQYAQDPYAIRPLPSGLPVADGIMDATLQAAFLPQDLLEDGDEISLLVDLYSMDLYDAVDVSMIDIGDTIYYDGQYYDVETLEEDNDMLQINGGFTEGGITLLANEGGTYRGLGFDDTASYSYETTERYVLAENCVLYDSFDISQDEQVIESPEAIADFLMGLDADFAASFYCLNTEVVIQSGEITEIYHWYQP